MVWYGVSVAIIMRPMLYYSSLQQTTTKSDGEKKGDALFIGIVYEFNQSIHSYLVHSIGKYI